MMQKSIFESSISSLCLKFGRMPCLFHQHGNANRGCDLVAVENRARSAYLHCPTHTGLRGIFFALSFCFLCTAWQTTSAYGADNITEEQYEPHNYSAWFRASVWFAYVGGELETDGLIDGRRFGTTCLRMASGNVALIQQWVDEANADPRDLQLAVEAHFGPGWERAYILYSERRR